jgi:hypothetical protein
MNQGIVPAGQPVLFNWAKGAVTGLVVPAGSIYWLRWAVANYTRDANVGNVAATLRLTLLNTAYGYIMGMSPMVASTAYTFEWGFGNVSSYGVALASQGGQVFPLYPGQALDFITYSAQATDAWTVEGLYFKTPLLGAP